MIPFPLFIHAAYFNTRGSKGIGHTTRVQVTTYFTISANRVKQL